MRDDLHPINYLFTLHDQFKSYPNGVIQIPKRIFGTAFFPGGYGLWDTQPDKTLPPMPVGGVMIVGHNFDSEVGFAYSVNNSGKNLKGSTWRNLLTFLKKVGIPRERCFFTNAYVGLQPGSRATGPFPGRSDPQFVNWCQNFLLEQIKLMQPSLILSLGAFVPSFLASLSPELSVWFNVKKFRTLDKQDVALVYPCTFVDVPHSVVVVALTHPSYRHVNVKHRQYRDLKGDAAEQALVKDALIRQGFA